MHEELRNYAHQMFLLESKRPQLAQEYPNHWVAMHADSIVAIEKEFDELLAKIDEKGVPRSDVFMEYLDTEKRCMIL